MTAKTIDKRSKPERSAATPRVAGTSAKPNRALAVTATKALKREETPEDRSAQLPNTKHAHLLQLLSRPKGASIEELVQATGWQQHSVRGFLAGTVKKMLGLVLT